MTAVVVPVYNGAAVVPATVPAVLGLGGVDEWVWVDDGSADQTATLVESLVAGHPRARLLRLPDNQGRASARNAGIASTSADVVVCLDADVEPEADAARALADAALQPGAVASVATLAPVTTDPDDPYHDYLAHHPRGPGRHPPEAPLDWRFFLSGACAVRRPSLDRAGGFPGDVDYGEDVALGCALARASPSGLRLAPTTVRLHGVPTLEGALARASAFGRALPAIRQRCDGGAVGRLARMQRWSLAARASAPVVRAAVSGLGPGPVRRRAVRYLLALTMLSAARA